MLLSSRRCYTERKRLNMNSKETIINLTEKEKHKTAKIAGLMFLCSLLVRECSKFCVTVQVSGLLLQQAEVEARPREWTPQKLSVGGGWLPLERVQPHSNYYLITNVFHIFNSLSSLPSKKIANCEIVSDQF